MTRETVTVTRTPQDYLNAITAKYPCPALSGFERAAWLYQTREAVRWIEGFITAEYKLQLAEIAYAGLTSENYMIEPVERQESRVDVERLRKQKPDVFKELVYLRASDAQKILGKRTLYELAREKVGADALRELEQVNVGDLERAMLAGKAAAFIDVCSKVVDWKVVEVET